MSQEFVSVPRDWLTQVSLMQMSHEELQDQAVGFLCEPCDEPVPPARGEVEVISGIDVVAASVLRFWAEDAHNIRCVRAEDFDAHVARLQADNAALQQCLTIADQRIDDLQSESFEALYNAAIEERDATQSELTKALELLGNVHDTCRFSMPSGVYLRLRDLLAGQAAPAIPQ